MQILLFQTFVWMLLAGLLGALLGCMAHRFFAERRADAVPATGVRPSAVTLPVAARAVPKAPVVEASKAPAPIAPAAPATAPDRAPGGYTYPITTVGIPRANPELVQPQIQTISLPSAAAAGAALAGAGAAAAAAAVTIRQPAAPGASVNTYPITTVGIPKGYVDLPASSAKAVAAGDASRFDRALTGEAGQPRPEPLRPELGRSAPIAAPVAPVAKAPAAPVAPSVATTVAPSAPAPVKPVAPAAVTPAVAAAVAPAAPVAPGAPAPVGKVPNAPIASKPAGIAAGSPPIGPIESRPAGIVPPKPGMPSAPVVAAAKPAASADVPFEPVVAGGAALAAIAARAASAQAAAAANAATSAPAAAAPAAVVGKPAEPVVASRPVTGGDDLMRIRAIDSVMQSRLKGAGVTRFSEIARWMPGDVARISQTLGLSGRIEQENWIEQAQILATGGETDYSRRRLRGEIPAAAAGATVAPAGARPATGGFDTSVAAATAAAAAMASAAISRATANVEPSMPSKLVDAIRENLAKPAAATPTVAAPAVAAVKAAVAPEDAPVADAGRVSRPDLAGLRSVRSEALRDTSAAGGAGRQGGAIEDLKRVRGIGVLIEKKLNSLGITGYEQIANWTNADIDRVSQILDFKGRIERENWVEQARILASGGQTEFSKRVDRGEA